MAPTYTSEELRTKKKIIDNSAIQAVGMAVNLVNSVVMTGVLARYLGVAGYGELSMALVYFSFSGIAACMGYDTVLTRELSRSLLSKDDLRTNIILSSGLFLRAISSVVAITGLFAVLIPMQYSTNFKAVILVMSVSHLASVLNIFDSLFNAALQVRYKVLSSILYRICHLAMVLGCVFSGLPLLAIVLTYIAGNLLYGLLLYRFSSRLLDFRFVWDKRTVRELFLQAMPLGISGALWVVYFRVDMLMLDAMKGIDAVSMYTAAYRFVDYCYMVSSMLITPIYPLMAARYLINPEGLRRLYRRTFDSFSFIGGTMGFSLILAAPFIAPLLFGNAFEAAIPAVAVFGFIFPIITLSNACGAMLIAMALPGRQLIGLRILAIGINVGLNLILIPTFSFYGAAIATVLSEFILLGVAVGIIKRRLGYLPSLVVFASLLGLCMVVFILSSLLHVGVLRGILLPAIVFILYVTIFQRALLQEAWAAVRMRTGTDAHAI